MGDLTIRNMTTEDLDKMMAEHKRLNPDLPIRDDIKNALDNWAEHGLKPGDFLTAVLENNLMEALGRADSYNRATIFQISQYLYNDMPGPCHGSPEKVKAWAEEFKKSQFVNGASMIGTLTFTLPEEKEDFELAQQGAAWKFVVDDLLAWIRSLDKYSEQTQVSIEEARNKILELMNHYDL